MEQPPPIAVSPGSVRQLPRELLAARELATDLVWKDLRVRYRYAALGFLWSVLEPLAYMAVLTFIFEWVLASKTGGAMFGDGIPFASGLLCGLVFWQFTAQSLSAATNSLVDNQHLVKKVAFTREVIPLAAMGYPTLSLLVGVCILLIVHTLLGGGISATAIWLLPLFLAQGLATVGLCLFCAALNVRFRDVGYMVSVTLVLGFYASPVFYDLNWVLSAAESGGIPAPVAWAYLANPMAPLLEAYRQALLEGRHPETWLLVWPSLFAVGALFGGAHVFRRSAPTLSDFL